MNKRQTGISSINLYVENNIYIGTGTLANNIGPSGGLEAAIGAYAGPNYPGYAGLLERLIGAMQTGQ